MIWKYVFLSFFLSCLLPILALGSKCANILDEVVTDSTKSFFSISSSRQVMESSDDMETFIPLILELFAPSTSIGQQSCQQSLPTTIFSIKN